MSSQNLKMPLWGGSLKEVSKDALICATPPSPYWLKSPKFSDRPFKYDLVYAFVVFVVAAV